jgi:hypothetical protein
MTPEEYEAKINELEMKVNGICPTCKEEIKGWEPVFGSFAPEWWQTMREQGIDPATGHKSDCDNKKLKL